MLIRIVLAVLSAAASALLILRLTGATRLAWWVVLMPWIAMGLVILKEVVQMHRSAQNAPPPGHPTDP
ncbi:hypothetical protein [uncultured Jannaschia sp.]|uniref:hypothetical protein n=1 Tax=uncultured Jannaschia sp. TaxID=293347 RepID=UPI0026205D73|nr:hypothetical protein [uncultured Jannaschia sp.]